MAPRPALVISGSTCLSARNADRVLPKRSAFPPRSLTPTWRICEKEKEDLLDDAGNELLYEKESLQKLTAAAERLGASESDRMRTLLEIKARAQKREAPTDALRRGSSG